MGKDIIKASEFGLEEKQVSDVNLAFSEKVKERELLSEIYGQLIKKDINKKVSLEAREFRLKAVRVKSGIASIHKTQKEFALAFGKYCDAWKRKETEPIQQMIDGAAEIEKFEQIQEQKRLEELQKERVLILSEYVDDAHERSLSDMDNDVWDAYLSTKKKEKEDRVAAEKKAEKERIAKEKNDKLRNKREILLRPYYSFCPDNHPDFGTLNSSEWDDFLSEMKNAKDAYDKEQEQIRKDNERLRKEAEIEAHKKAKEEAVRKARVEKEREAHEAAIRKEREAREKIEAELRAKAKAEQERKEEEEARLQYELNKGDSDKVKDLISDLESLKTKYTFKSKINIKRYSDVGILIDKVIDHIRK